MHRRRFLTIFLAFLITSTTSAQTIVPGGNVSGIWDAAGTPYLIMGEITIPASDSLIIESGVEVIFQGHGRFYVYGWLLVRGTETQPVWITAANTSEGWNALRFVDAPPGNSLEYCIIEHSNNWSVSIFDPGGGISCTNSSVSLRNCTIKNCQAAHVGGGIGCVNSDVDLYGCTIKYNSVSETYSPLGGGIYAISNSTLTLERCILHGNTSTYLGGGIYNLGSDMTIANCTFNFNNSSHEGDNLWFSDGTGYFYNSIFWSDDPDHFYISGYASVSFCDIAGGFPGVGNINGAPLFLSVQYDDYRLRWGSPCIDAGSYDPQYNDPDSTVNDMGAFYYDQSIPVSIQLIPYDFRIEIPRIGGSFEFDVRLTNIDPSPPLFESWIDVTCPDGSTLGPLLGPFSVTLDSGQSVIRDREQEVPPAAPGGFYIYNAYALVEADTSHDSFTFFKFEPDGSDWVSGWENMGESNSSDEISGGSTPALQLPSDFSLAQNYPNPFNLTTTIRFTLPYPEHVTVTVHNVLGQEVARLIDGNREVGYHEVMFDASDLTSGIYYCQMNTREFTTANKILLVK